MGLITDGDVRRAFDSDRDYKTIDAAQMMTREPKTVPAGMRFAEAEAKMRDNWSCPRIRPHRLVAS